MDVLKLRVGYDMGRLEVSLESLSARLRDHLAAALEIPIRIELIDEQELLKLGPPHKIPRVTKQ